MSQPLISERNSWANFEKCVLEVCIIALKILRSQEVLPLAEDSLQSCDTLNRRLYICFRSAFLEWEKENEPILTSPPTLNSAKQPDLDNEDLVGEYERTKPDFQWGFVDRLGNENSLNSTFKNYEIECKRLGSRLSSGQNLAKEYVLKGILRFTMDTHRYGQFTSSGLMIGYIQDSNFDAVLNEVNSTAQSALLAELLLSSEGWKSDVSRLDHNLDRPGIEPTPFDLRHFWVDLHHHYEQQSSSPKMKTTAQKKKAGGKIKE
jgi:hypothetical protein